MDLAIFGHMIRFAEDLFFGDDDDDDTNMNLQKVENYAEEVVPRFTDNQFQQNFRMFPDTFEDLVSKLYRVEIPQVEKGHPELPLEKQAMIMLWYLGNMESFRSVAERFGISKSASWHILYRTCKRLIKVNRTFRIICWPSEPRALRIIQDFHRISNFPGVIGAIDGTHIPITKPKHHGNSYINRKSYASVLLQGVCDNKKLFTDVYAGEPGSIHDARLFTKSDLYIRIQNGDAKFPLNSHLIGDLAYKLSTKLMVGFKSVGQLTPAQVNYNIKLSQARAVIENAFGLLKGRFRRLKLLETVKLDLISLLIVSSCILHNICLLAGDIPNDIDIEHRFPNQDQANEGVLNMHGAAAAAAAAIAKRNVIVNELAVLN